MRRIRIDNIPGGTYPISVYIADVFGNNKSLIGVINPGPVPPEVSFTNTIPSIFSTEPEIMLILEDNVGCEVFKILECGEPPTEQYFAYIFPEPLDSVSQQSLGTYMLNNGGTYFGFANNGFAPPSTLNYDQNMSLYVTYPDWNGGVGNFITPVSDIKSPVKQTTGTTLDIFSCPVRQFNFETIEILHNTMINANIRYNYTIWLPLESLGNSFVNMKVDVGTDPCDNSLFNDSIPDTTLAGIDVEVPAGAAIPEGTYRVLWTYLLPTTAPINEDLYFKGDGIIT
jgi:hypothetical protein